MPKFGKRIELVRPTSLALDVVILCLTINIGSFILYLFYRDDTFALSLYLLIVLASYFSFSVLPILKSTPTGAFSTVHLPPRTTLRVSGVGKAFSISLLYRRFIIIPKHWIGDNNPENLLPQIVHEAAHLKAGDGRLFQHTASLLAANIMFCAYPLVNMLFLGSTQEGVFGSFENDDGKVMYTAMVFGFFVLNPLVLLFIIVLTVRDREYLADDLAYTLIDNQYLVFLNRMALREKYTVQKNIITHIYNRIMHPTFKARVQSISYFKGTLSQPTIAAGTLGAIVIILQIVSTLGSFYAMSSRVWGSIFQIEQFGAAVIIAAVVLFSSVTGLLSVPAYFSTILASSANHDKFIQYLIKSFMLTFGASAGAVVCTILIAAPASQGILLEGIFSPNSFQSLPLMFGVLCAGLAVLWLIISRLFNWIPLHYFFHIALSAIIVKLYAFYESG